MPLLGWPSPSRSHAIILYLPSCECIPYLPYMFAAITTRKQKQTSWVSSKAVRCLWPLSLESDNGLSSLSHRLHNYSTLKSFFDLTQRRRRSVFGHYNGSCKAVLSRSAGANSEDAGLNSCWVIFSNSMMYRRDSSVTRSAGASGRTWTRQE